MRKSFIPIIILMLSFTVMISAEWKVLDSSNEVRSTESSTIKVEITIPEYKLEKVKINNQECVVLHMPEASMYMKRGFPMVPKLTKLVKVHEYCDIKLEIISKEEVEVPLEAPIVPSKGHFTREIPYDSVPFEFGPIYKENVYWPSEKEQFDLGEPFLFRDMRGVRVQILPIRANHVAMKMKVLKKAVIALVCEGRSVKNVTSTRRSMKPSRTFRSLYQESFLNPETETTDRGTVPPESNKKLVVVTPTEFEGLLGDWVNWKKQCGYQVTIKSVASGTTASTIKSYLQGLYDNTDTRFGYVVLIGDASYNSNFEAATPMPSFKGKYESAAADRVYVRLAGNDNYPDAFISRISGSAADITAQLNKIINYEKNPVGGTWYNKGVCIASNQGSPTDYERAEWIQNGGGTGQKIPVVTGGLIKYGVSAFDDIYDPSASSSAVTNAVNNGRSIICYIGHGSSTSWGTTGFNTTAARNLTNGGMLPVIWSVACVNGDFLKTSECFAEAWLRNSKGGAIAMEAASTNEAWVPPCDKQAATVNAIIQKTHSTFGALEAVGCIKGLEVWGDTDKGQGNQMAEQCNLFGDCTVVIRTKAPGEIAAQVSRSLDNNLSFQVTSEGRGQADITVTVYTADFSFVATGETDEFGNIGLSLEGCPSDAKLMYTVVGPDMIPVVDQPIE